MSSPLTRLLLSLWTSPRGWGGALAKRIPGSKRSVPPHPLTTLSLSAPSLPTSCLPFLSDHLHPSFIMKKPDQKETKLYWASLIVATKACWTIYWTIMWLLQKLNRQGIVKWWSHTFNDWFDIDPWLGNIPWRREWLSSPLFLPGEFHGQRSLAGYNPRVHKRDRHDGATNTFTTFTFLAQLPTRREWYGSCTGAQG